MVEKLEELLLEFASSEIILLGDFNTRGLGGKDLPVVNHKEQEIMNSFLINHNLRSAKQVIREHDLTAQQHPTFKNISTIDYIFLSPIIGSKLIHMETCPRFESDHNPITVTLDLRVPEAVKKIEVGHTRQNELHSLVRRIKWDVQGPVTVGSWFTDLYSIFSQQLPTDLHLVWGKAIDRLRALLTVPGKSQRSSKPFEHLPSDPDLALQKRALRKAERQHKLRRTAISAKQKALLRLTYKKSIWRAKALKAEKDWIHIFNLLKEKHLSRFWSYINRLRSSSTKRGNAVPEDVWVQYVTQQFSSDYLINGEVEVKDPLDASREEAYILISSIEVSKLLKVLKKDGAPGPNGLPAAVYKSAPEDWAKLLVPLFNHACTTFQIPDSWKGSILCPIFKKGDPSLPSNYRLIALLDLEAKVYARTLLNQLEQWVTENNILPYFQTGFRASASTVDNITTLAILSHQATQKNHLPLYCCFIDYSAALTKCLATSYGGNWLSGGSLGVC